MMNGNIAMNNDEIIRCNNDELKNYEIKKLIGQGEFCDVYKAIDRHNGKIVALKRLKIQQIDNGQTRIECYREISVLKQLDHQNIIKLLNSFLAFNEIYIILEYADAGDLSKMIKYLRKNNNLLSEIAVLNFFKQISEALNYMHSKYIMHRDIKPANVLIKQNHTVKLADFGFSRLLSSSTINTNTLVGTPYYMAPERLDELSYTFSADIWSMGCLLYELIKLYPPFYQPNQSIDQLRKKIQQLNYEPICTETYHIELMIIIQNCLCLSPAKRWNIKQILTMINIIETKNNKNKQQSLFNSHDNFHNSNLNINNNNNNIETFNQRERSKSDNYFNINKSNHDENQQQPKLSSASSLTVTTNTPTTSSSSSSATSMRKIYKNLKKLF